MAQRIIAIPDVHGRTFWKESLEYLDSVDRVVFLGDYLDPYWGERGVADDILSNFMEIISLKQKNMDKVVLLKGNHDEHYSSKTGSVLWADVDEHPVKAPDVYGLNKVFQVFGHTRLDPEECEFIAHEHYAMMDLSVAIANRIYDILEAKGMSQKDFAQLMGKTETEVSRWLSGTHNLTLATICKISTALNDEVISPR